MHPAAGGGGGGGGGGEAPPDDAYDDLRRSQQAMLAGEGRLGHRMDSLGSVGSVGSMGTESELDHSSDGADLMARSRDGSCTSSLEGQLGGGGVSQEDVDGWPAVYYTELAGLGQ